MQNGGVLLSILFPWYTGKRVPVAHPFFGTVFSINITVIERINFQWANQDYEHI